MKPALTAEEWAECEREGPHYMIGWLTSEKPTGQNQICVGDAGYVDRAALAAISLYGQSFGFTREDVELLDSFDHPDDQERVGSLKARILALLPPEG